MYPSCCGWPLRVRVDAGKYPDWTSNKSKMNTIMKKCWEQGNKLYMTHVSTDKNVKMLMQR